MKRFFLIGILTLVGLVTSSPAAGTIVILSGALTTVTHSALPSAGFSRVTEKHFFILDHVTGKYSQYRVYLDNTRKKKVEEIYFGTCSGHATAGDKNANSTVYEYLDIRASASFLPAQDPTNDEWLQLFGVVTAALRDSINGTNLVPASMAFSYRHFYRSPANDPNTRGVSPRADRPAHAATKALQSGERCRRRSERGDRSRSRALWAVKSERGGVRGRLFVRHRDEDQASDARTSHSGWSPKL